MEENAGFGMHPVRSRSTERMVRIDEILAKFGKRDFLAFTAFTTFHETLRRSIYHNDCY
jgi:hypothetical protein